MSWDTPTNTPTGRQPCTSVHLQPGSLVASMFSEGRTGGKQPCKHSVSQTEAFNHVRVTPGLRFSGTAPPAPRPPPFPRCLFHVLSTGTQHVVRDFYELSFNFFFLFRDRWAVSHGDAQERGQEEERVKLRSARKKKNRKKCLRLAEGR